MGGCHKKSDPPQYEREPTEKKALTKSSTGFQMSSKTNSFQFQPERINPTVNQTSFTQRSTANLNSYLMYSSDDVEIPIQKLQLSPWYCPSDFPIVNVCTQQSCISKNAFYCSEHKCPTCSKLHLGHDHITLWEVTKLIDDRTKDLRNFTIRLLQIENQFFNQVKNFRKTLVDEYKWVRLDTENQKILEKLLKNQKVDLTTKQAHHFRESLKEGDKAEEDRFLQEFSAEVQKIKADVNKKKQQIIKRVSSREVFSNFYSKIVHQDTYNFIAKALTFEDNKRPKQLQLLYRGSEHEFLASEFHKACDNKPHTLTLIKTNFGSTVAGYTPLSWQSCQGKYLADPSKRSFLLSLTNLQKLTLIRKEFAIHSDKDWGPIFGGSDLSISDRCNINKESSCGKFPFSYNYFTKYKNNQTSKLALCGVPEGNNFEVLEYEVFQVKW